MDAINFRHLRFSGKSLGGIVMKKSLLFLFIAVFVLSAAGCGSKSSDNADAGGAYMADTEPVVEKSAAYDSMNFGG